MFVDVGIAFIIGSFDEQMIERLFLRKDDRSSATAIYLELIAIVSRVNTSYLFNGNCLSRDAVNYTLQVAFSKGTDRTIVILKSCFPTLNVVRVDSCYYIFFHAIEVQCTIAQMTV